MKVLQIFMRNSLRNFNYIVYSESNKKAIFIDPLDISKTLPECQRLGLEPVYLLNTHGHGDHTRGNKDLLSQTGVDHLAPLDGDIINLSESESLRAISTPGHTMDHMCFVLEENGRPTALMSGDTLFNAGVGNCKNGGDPETLYKSVCEKLAPLPEDLTLWPGHDYLFNNLKFAKTIDPDNKDIHEMLEKREAMNCDEEFIVTDLKTERKINPFLRLERLPGKFEKLSAKEAFLELRSLRDKW